MFQGTGSGVGKSIVVAAMCRLLRNKGVKVAPFKAQNMALNSFVTGDGKEMGRAQVFQAEACGLLPDVRMNPVLLKPSADARSQVILMGEPREHLGALDYYKRSRIHWQVVTEAYDSLSQEYDVIVIEGAGSPAEINLQETDIVNMKMANYAGSSVIIVADIDKGGVFASLKGTYDLIQEEYRHLVKGFLINKFRGDVRLLEPGLEMFFRLVPVPVMGVLPWFHDILVDEEDGVFVNKLESGAGHDRADKLRVCIVRLPRISNFTDFTPLGLEPDVEIFLSQDPHVLSRCDLVILPGTKATTSDLEFLAKKGWTGALSDFIGSGGAVVGICGGFQMLGERINDPFGSDGSPGEYQGFGLLPVATEMASKKVLKQLNTEVICKDLCDKPMEIKGYEIHMGRSYLTKEGPADVCVFEAQGGQIRGIFDGSRRVFGTYVHGIFDNDLFRRSFLNFVRKGKGFGPLPVRLNYREYRLSQFDRLAEWLSSNCDVDKLLGLVDV